MKAARFWFAGVLSVLVVFALAANLPADETDDTSDDTSELGTDGTEDAEVPKNETEQEKAQRLSDASGVSVDDILSMRNGTYVPPEGGETTEGPNGRGWGNIAKYLGLHPGILGKGTGDKFMPTDGTGDSLLAKRQNKRDSRLYGKKGEDTEDGEDSAVKGKDRNTDKRVEKMARNEERSRDKNAARDNNRKDKKDRKDKSGDRGKSDK